MRVTDEMVRDWLVWARNFGEVVAYRVGSGSGRRFRVRVTPGVTRDGHPFRPKQGILDLLGHNADDVVPAELMLTAREALVFGYGCAVGRASALAGLRPDWREEWSADERAEFERRQQAMRDAEAEETEREAVAREEERQCRMAAYRARKEAEGRELTP